MTATLIKTVQARIEGIYGIAVGEAAQDYLITRDELTALLPAQQRTVVPKELFLVNPKPADDTLEIALFFDPVLIENLRTNDPLEKLDAANISDFCTLVEGVSHFVYYLHKASLEHEITELELELQAEIDKFVLLSFSIESTNPERHRILELLFEDYCLHKNLKPEQEERYRTATKLASKYCYGLLKDFKQTGPEEVLQEVRSFYPLRQEQKIQYIMA